jgi:hypothetical protein
MTARVIPTRPGVARCLVRAVHLAVLRWELSCLRDEREHYDSLGWVGPVYMRNSLQKELQLMARIRQLESA